MGHNLDEAEELVKRVTSVVDSTDHFILQTLPLLEEVCVCVYVCVSVHVCLIALVGQTLRANVQCSLCVCVVSVLFS